MSMNGFVKISRKKIKSSTTTIFVYSNVEKRNENKKFLQRYHTTFPRINVRNFLHQTEASSEVKLF